MSGRLLLIVAVALFLVGMVGWATGTVDAHLGVTFGGFAAAALGLGRL